MCSRLERPGSSAHAKRQRGREARRFCRAGGAACRLGGCWKGGKRHILPKRLQHNLAEPLHTDLAKTSQKKNCRNVTTEVFLLNRYQQILPIRYTNILPKPCRTMLPSRHNVLSKCGQAMPDFAGTRQGVG